jgi:hypothetical protein
MPAMWNAQVEGSQSDTGPDKYARLYLKITKAKKDGSCGSSGRAPA